MCFPNLNKYIISNVCFSNEALYSHLSPFHVNLHFFIHQVRILRTNIHLLFPFSNPIFKELAWETIWLYTYWKLFLLTEISFCQILDALGVIHNYWEFFQQYKVYRGKRFKNHQQITWIVTKKAIVFTKYICYDPAESVGSQKYWLCDIARIRNEFRFFSIVLRILQLLITLEPLVWFIWCFQQNVPLSKWGLQSNRKLRLQNWYP